jgi:hypothetical protein
VQRWKRQAPWRTDDWKDRLLCQSLDPKMSDRNRSEGPVLRLPR